MGPQGSETTITYLPLFLTSKHIHVDAHGIISFFFWLPQKKEVADLPEKREMRGLAAPAVLPTVGGDVAL